MKLAIPKERALGETRVAIVPDTVKRLVAKGIEVCVEVGAGEPSFFSDEAYRTAGAQIVSDPDAVFSNADVVVQIHAPHSAQVAKLRDGATLVSALDTYRHRDLLHALLAHNITAISVDLIPRTTLAQSMDVLSSQTTTAGYHGVLLAAAALPKFFPMLMTAAGTIAPAKVLVVGAGVCGLQAIATSRRLGAVVEAYDVRRAVKEQVQSLGARFIDIEGVADAETRAGYAREVSADERQKQTETLAKHLSRADVCITTALVPGRPAPRLISAEMVRGMRPGSVIVDLAAERGGNCELTRPGETHVVQGVTLMAPVNLPARVNVDASHMYSRNMEKLVLHLFKGASTSLDLNDEIAKECVILHAGRAVHPRIAEALFEKGAA